MPAGFQFNYPPNWPPVPDDWSPSDDWVPDPSLPPPPAGWVFWSPLQPEAVLPPTPSELEVIHAIPEEVTSQPGESTLVDDLSSKIADQSLEESVVQDTSIVAKVGGESGATETEMHTPPASPERDGAEIESLKQRVAELQSQLAETDSGSRDQVIDLNDERVLQEVGIYRYHHPLENSQEFRTKLSELQEAVKTAISSGNAIRCSDMFTFDNSLAKGRRMTSDLGKLMLRAYNAEADNCVRSLRAGNVITAKKRLESAASSIAKLGAIMEMSITADYQVLRISELELTADYLMKVQEEKEMAREKRERLREERRLAQELATQREKLEKERAHYEHAIEALKASGSEEGLQELIEKLGEIEVAIEQNDFRAANIRAGYIYVISNEGAFGSRVVKIGLTRRLEPLERIHELSGASVPFPFDVHVLYFSDDAVTLENELHKAFEDRRVNYVNARREFFFADPAEVRKILEGKVGSLLEFVEKPEATQFRQSKSSWPDLAP